MPASSIISVVDLLCPTHPSHDLYRILSLFRHSSTPRTPPKNKMYVPIAAEFGNAVEYAANVLAKRGTEGEVEPFTISHASSFVRFPHEGSFKR